ncbi:MAG TPA: tetratricopeptide repeat protein [Bordetella sp.]|jgi:TPR repeat protein|nr:tetratricopeptide repeat protein [Bordetella sp.]
MSMNTMSLQRLVFGAGLISVLLLGGCGLREALDAKARANGEAKRIATMKAGAESGNANFQNQYGEYFANEKNDDLTAHTWYVKSAQGGDAGGEENLAWDYAKGRGGVTKNDALAASWMQKSADQGRSSAEYAMSQMYAEGRGVPKNKAKQIALLQKAGLHSNPSAIHDLIFMGDPGGVAAQMYAKGEANLRARDEAVNNFHIEQLQKAIENSQPAPQRMCIANSGSQTYEIPCPY